MGICMDIGRNGLGNHEVKTGPTSFGSWPRQLNGFNDQQQMRTMSEPNINFNGVNADKQNVSSGAEQPKRVPLVLQRKVIPIDFSDIPDVPIIFILGGPGSGKITHCDHLARVDNRLIHLNMQSTFLEMAADIGSHDPNIVPAYKALEIFLGILSKITITGAFIITGYPRNMRDVVEYMARVQRVDGVVLLDWSDRSLEKQLQLGQKTGDIDVNLARFEMNNYRSNIIPVAQFFDQQGHLHIIAGQRLPGEIFEDLKEEIRGILSHLEHFGEMLPPEAPQLINDDVEEIVSAEETNVVVHTPAESNLEQRKKSIDSVDLMIEEEIKIIDELSEDTSTKIKTSAKESNTE